MEHCCNSCGMLECNKDNQRTGNDGLGWYTQENLDRLWETAKTTGQFLICHSTDPTAKTYNGEPGIKPGRETTCLGFTMWVFMHVKVFESYNCSYTSYVKSVGKEVAMTFRALQEVALNFVTGSTGFGTSGPLKGLLIPQTFSDKREIRYPTGFSKTIEKFNELKSQHSAASECENST